MRGAGEKDMEPFATDVYWKQPEYVIYGAAARADRVRPGAAWWPR